jgi:hypothetical protein
MPGNAAWRDSRLRGFAAVVAVYLAVFGLGALGAARVHRNYPSKLATVNYGIFTRKPDFTALKRAWLYVCEADRYDIPLTLGIEFGMSYRLRYAGQKKRPLDLMVDYQPFVGDLLRQPHRLSRRQYLAEPEVTEYFLWTMGSEAELRPGIWTFSIAETSGSVLLSKEFTVGQ